MDSRQPRYVISNLRERPEFCDVVADRIWQAWWKDAGHPLSRVHDHMQEMLDERPLPFGLVAHEEGRYLGSCLIIECDLEERPQLAPWVAAVWVDPEYRSRGVGRTLVRRGERAALDLGHDAVYLCALPEKCSFYQDLGWRPVEEGVGPHGLTVLSRSRES
ncbi:GNAT family N-acetyltransferase [Consotaella aegiceratis]|uniref:GNAT family N-acetyltransferase n=1 Tax=Consotaella aegiceratis TaxID=3097961 RepID=UPI003D80043E